MCVDDTIINIYVSCVKNINYEGEPKIYELFK